MNCKKWEELESWYPFLHLDACLFECISVSRAALFMCWHFKKILWYQFSLAFQTHSCSQRRNFYSIRCLPNALQMMQMRVLQINTSFFPSSRYISILQIYIQQFINLWKFFYVDENRSKFEKKNVLDPFLHFSAALPLSFKHEREERKPYPVFILRARHYTHLNC